MKLNSTNIITFSLIAFIVMLVSCVEEIPLQTEGFEEAIVIEATITDEVKQQQIKLSKTFAIDTDGPNPLTGAQIKVIGDRDYIFEETQPGLYVSVDDFAAQAGVNYQLKISADGEEYESESLQLTGSSTIEELKANRTDIRGENGVTITLSNQTSEGFGSYYRYEYTETFKFNSTFFKVNDIIVEDGEVVEVPKQREEYTCYRTDESQDIILANTNSLSENSVNNLLITFINSNDPKLSNRYSILVRQYEISQGAYTYYKVLEELSGSANLFSQTQPGFFAGNISNINDPEEKIIGFFDVSSVSTKRLYFNFEDFYSPGSVRPAFTSITNCEVTTPDNRSLIIQIQQNSVRWSSTLPDGTIEVVPRRCVDCTVFGTNERPEFWED